MPSSIDALLMLMQRLRDPRDGCPWDRAQTLNSLVQHTVEEAYEVAEAVERGEIGELAGELGDLLFQVVFYAQIASEAGYFGFAEVVEGIHDKLVRRHPHLFGRASVRDATEQAVAWEQMKAVERAAHRRGAGPASELDDVPLALPAMTRARKLQQRASRVGFDWGEAPPVLDKIAEELAELKEAMAQEAPQQAQAEELGDLIFAVVNLARHLGLDPEAATRAANRKFERRFRYVEAALRESGKTPAQSDLAEMDALWDRAKGLGL